MQTELRGVLFPLFVHCFFELLSRNLVREGTHAFLYTLACASRATPA